MTPLRTVLLAALLAFAAPAVAQDAYVPLEQRLSAEQLRATGLDQLDAEQLRLLNTLLRDEQTAQVAAVREEVEEQAEQQASRGGLFKRDREPIVSKIVGEFRGWTSNMRFQLENGQTWRVIGTPEYYLPRSRAVNAPAVAITPGLVSGWYMQVEGQSPRAKVQLVD